VLCGILTCFALSLPIASGVPQAPPSGAQQEDGGDDAPLPYGSYPLAPVGEAQEPGEGPVNAYLLTMLVLVGASFFGTGVGWLLMWNARRGRGADRSWVADDRSWSGAADEGRSLLGVFLL
jgi:hypothetical protein